MNTYAPSDLTFDRGLGSWLFDDKGYKYLDFASGIAVNSVGHSHPHVVSAIQKQAAKLIHTSNLYNISQQEKLAKRLCDLSFADCVFFSNSGAEANEGAVKVARRYMFEKGKPERNVILCVDGCFHGRTISMLSATSKKENRTGFGPLPGGFRHIAFNDLNSLAEQFAAKDVAAIMIEPVLGEGGAKSISKEFFKKAQELANNNNCLVISDEVQTGIGRLGTLFGYEKTDLKPDIMAIAKGLGGGVPIGAVLANKKVASAMKPGSHGSTFGGNPLASSVCMAALKVIVDENLSNNSYLLGEKFRSSLKSYIDKSSIVLSIRGKGLLNAIEIDNNKKNDLAWDICLKLKEKGLLAKPTHGNIIRFAPPLVITEEELDKCIQIITSTLKIYEESKIEI